MIAQYLVDGLQAAGLKLAGMEARQVRIALSALRNKTDKHDSRGTAWLLRRALHGAAHIRSLESHHIRKLLASASLSQLPESFLGVRSVAFNKLDLLSYSHSIVAGGLPEMS
jgi:hypothetical protein